MMNRLTDGLDFNAQALALRFFGRRPELREARRSERVSSWCSESRLQAGRKRSLEGRQINADAMPRLK